MVGKHVSSFRPETPISVTGKAKILTRAEALKHGARFLDKLEIGNTVMKGTEYFVSLQTGAVIIEDG
jgi:hypothetical protein